MNNFVITIARGYGSGGKTMGEMLAKELGVHFYNRELMRVASDESGINEELFVEVDEQPKKNILPRIGKKEFKGDVIPPTKDEFLSRDNLFNYQAKAIRKIAETESCVIVGRCADYVLRDMKNVVKIYVHASLEDCVERLESMYHLPKKELEKKVIETDKKRAEYYKYYTGRNWNDANNYDLCLNSQQLGFDKCVEIVKAYLKIIGAN